MSRLKRSRALRRNLRKQARKGTLSAREQQTLLNQEKKFRKAARRRRRGIGAGIGAALGAGVGAYLASPAFASLLERGASKEDIDRAVKAQGGSPEDAAKVNEAVEQAPEGSSPEQIVQEVEEQVASAGGSGDAAEDLADQLELERMDRNELLDPRGIRGEALGDDELIRDLEAIEEDSEAPIDDELARASLSEQLQGLSDFPGERVVMGDPATLRPIGPGVIDQDNPYMNQGGLRDIDPRTEQRLAAARESMRLRDNERSSDNMRERTETLERLRREGGFDPFTGEFVDSDRQQRIDDEFDRDFERSAFTDAERAAEARNAMLDAADAAAANPGLMDPLGPESFDENFVRRPRMGNMSQMGGRRSPRRIFNEENEMARAEQNRRLGGSGIPVRQKMGGKNPKMADLMKRVKAKYGIR